MKKFTKQEIIELYGQVTLGEISFSRMVEILNERVSESGKPNFKEGDFLHSDWDDENITIIFKNQVGDNLYYHASKSCYFGVAVDNDRYWRDGSDFRHATEAEKQELLDAMAKEGKRWNAEMLCVEDLPEELKKGDLVIFWDDDKEYATIKFYERLNEREESYRHTDQNGCKWENAIKFESKEQFERLINGEI